MSDKTPGRQLLEAHVLRGATPRTDAAKHNMGSVSEPHYVVDEEVARQLERELAEADEWTRKWRAMAMETNQSSGPNWRSPKDKPANLPGEHHSENVLIVMRDWVDRGPVVKIGHVSLGHWRPAGGNGNFDNDVLGWMPLPDASSFATSRRSEEPK